MRLPVEISSVESNHIPARHPAFLRRMDDIELFLPESGLVRGKGPSGEKSTPGRSEPMELCSTEDHDHHLLNEAVAT